MPIYTFYCKKCKYSFDDLVESYSTIKNICPICGLQAHIDTQSIAIPAIQFKGPGFYVTDNPKKEK